MRLPRSETDPTKVHATVGALAYHMIATAVLLDRHLTLGTLFRVGRDPVACLTLVNTFLLPTSH